MVVEILHRYYKDFFKDLTQTNPTLAINNSNLSEQYVFSGISLIIKFLSEKLIDSDCEFYIDYSTIISTIETKELLDFICIKSGDLQYLDYNKIERNYTSLYSELERTKKGNFYYPDFFFMPIEPNGFISSDKNLIDKKNDIYNLIENVSTNPNSIKFEEISTNLFFSNVSWPISYDEFKSNVYKKETEKNTFNDNQLLFHHNIKLNFCNYKKDGVFTYLLSLPIVGAYSGEEKNNRLVGHGAIFTFIASKKQIENIEELSIFLSYLVKDLYFNFPFSIGLNLARTVKEKSLQSANAAIQARNKSHNIGSHVVPRATVEKIIERIEAAYPQFRIKERQEETKNIRYAIQNQINEVDFLNQFDKWKKNRNNQTIVNLADWIVEYIEKKQTIFHEQITDEKLSEYFFKSFFFEKLSIEQDAIIIESIVKESIISNIRGKLDEYNQKKDDYLAEITTEPLATTKQAYFYKDIILPFVQNSLIMDNIAKNEDIRYWDKNHSTDNQIYKPRKHSGNLFENRLKIRVFIEGKEQKADFRENKDKIRDVETFRYPYAMPYTLRDRTGRDILEFVGIETENDIEVELPGPLGEMAFYSFLENYIRNSSKHNESYLKNKDHCNEDLEIIIDIRQPKAENEQQDFYEVFIYNNITENKNIPTRVINNAECKTLQEEIAAYIQADIVKDGELVKQAWGIADMKINATLLRGSTDFINMKNYLQIIETNHRKTLLEEREYPDSEVQEPPKEKMLAYRFLMMKSKKIGAVLTNTTEIDIRKLKNAGIEVFGNIKELEEKALSKSVSSFKFAVFDSNLPNLEEIRKVLPKLPFRVLLINPGNTGNLATIFDLIDNKHIVHHPNRSIDFTQTPDIIEKQCWEIWLSRWNEREKVNVQLYLGQNKTEAPTKQWIKYGEKFNEKTENQKLIIAETDGRDIYYVNEKDIDAAAIQVYFDRHGGLFDVKSRKITPDLFRKDSYIFLDKQSSDFVKLFQPGFPQSADVHWSIPYQLAETGLLRVLIIDERIAEMSANTFDDIDVDSFRAKSSMRKYLEKGENLTHWHLAWFSKVYITNWFQIDNLFVHPKLQVSTYPQLKISVNNQNGNFTIKKEAIISNKLENLSSELQKIDMLIIHQGILDTIRSNFNIEQDDFLENIRKTIPFIVVDSGKGIPHTLKEDEKFLPFSLLQNYVLDKRISKYSLLKTTMALTRKK